MAKSQNGYSANDRSKVASYKIPGGKIAVRKGDVATILVWIANEFHKTVEPLKWPGNWGYAERPIRGGRTLSNHASGTAIDLNAPQHPLGKRGTFSKAEVKAIRRILAVTGSTVRWGGDYRSRADEMHFEIVGSPAAVAKVAAKIRGGAAPSKPAPSKPAGWKNLAVDGDLGPATIKALQRAVGTTADGDIGPATIRALQRKLRLSKKQQDGKLGPITVRALQRKVNITKTKGGKVTGTWGPLTTRALQTHLNYWKGKL